MWELFKRFIISNCNSFIVVYNYSGGLERLLFDDVRMIDRIWEIVKFFGIMFNDYIIVIEEGYYFFVENNMLQG